MSISGEHTDEPVTVCIKEFCRRTGISRTQTYHLLDTGKIDSVKINDMRLIIWDSYYRLMDKSRVPPKHTHK
jgi:hypothetical protein